LKEVFQMKKHRFQRAIALLLAAIMVIAFVPAELLAQEGSGGYIEIGEAPSYYMPYMSTTTPAALEAATLLSAPFDLIISTQTAEAGEEISVTVSIDNNYGFAAIPLRIDFLNDLTLQRFDVGSNFQNAIFEATYGVQAGEPIPAGTISNYIYFVWANGNNFTANGELLTLYFLVSGNAEPGFYPITATFADRYGPSSPIDYAGNALSANIIRGGVEILGPPRRPCGDVSGNGIVDEFDATLIARHLAGHPNLHLLPGTTYPVSQFGFDINYGRVTPHSRLPGNNVRVADITLILRYLAGHDVVICDCDFAPHNEITGVSFDTATNAAYVEVTANANTILQVSILEDVVGSGGDWSGGRQLASGQITISDAIEREEETVSFKQRHISQNPGHK
jgi:hypothetical protein